MRAEKEIREILFYCQSEEDKLPSMHWGRDFLFGVQRGLLWALGDIETVSEIWVGNINERITNENNI